VTSTSRRDGAFVWVWLPGSTEPVVSGRLRRVGERYDFAYGRSYLGRAEAISLYGPELPLREGWIEPRDGLDIASSLRDAGPDSWGQRVILDRMFGVLGPEADPGDTDHLTYFMESGSNRIGALDFQSSAEHYIPRADTASLDELHTAADELQAGHAINPVLAHALVHGTSVGGARPKVLLEEGGVQIIAKLSSSSDPYPVVKAEALGFEFARRVGINTPKSRLTTSLGRDVLLIERFDRTAHGARRSMVSGLTMLGLHEMVGRYATYPDLLDVLRRDGVDADVGRRLFERIVFNVAIGNTDDHARNHAAFWDGTHLELTPAYDLCPQIRSGETANQALAIDYDGNKESAFRVCLDACGLYGLSRSEAKDVIDGQIDVIESDWDAAADTARLNTAERNSLYHRQVLNPYASYGYGGAGT